MRDSTKWLIYKIIVFYCFLSSARTSLTLGDNPYIDMILGIISIMILPKSYITIRPTRKVAAIFLALAAAYTMIQSSIIGCFAQIFMVFIPCQLIFLKAKYQIELFNWLSKWFAILLIASFIWWILWMIGISLPHTTEQLDWEYDDEGFILENYFLFRRRISIDISTIVDSMFRFNGFFLEPGHVGTITTFFLFANKYNFKDWRNKIFILIIIASLSAAAYALTFFGYCLFRFTENKTKIIVAIIGVAIIGIIIITYNGGDNYVNDILLAKYTRDSGIVEGRFSEHTQQLWNQLLSDGRIIFGVGANVDVAQSAGYKVFLIMNGLFGSSLTIISYWLILQTNRSKLGFFLFVLILISFLQRAYCFWDAFLDPFILGTAILRQRKISLSKRLNKKEPKIGSHPIHINSLYPSTEM